MKSNVPIPACGEIMTSSRRRTLLCGLLLLFAACDDPLPPEPEPQPDPAPPLLQSGVSEPAARGAASAVPSGMAAAVSAGLAYVAFAEGELGDAVSVVIGNATKRILDPAVYPVNAGALDPVAVPAEVDDTIQVMASYLNGSVAFMRMRVPARRPPRIIRTSPTKGRTDVALNATVVVVFSEPIDEQTITTETVRLSCGGTPASASIIFGSPATAVALVPEQPLPQNAVCKLLVDEAVADLSGDTLEEPLEVEFRTADGDEPKVDKPKVDEPVDVDLVVIVPPSDPWLEVGDTAFLSAGAYKNHQLVAIHFTWTSSDTSVASVSQIWGSYGQVRGLAPGTAEITAAAGGQTARMLVTVSDPDAGFGSITGWIHDAATGSPIDRRVRIRLHPVLNAETYFDHGGGLDPGAYQEDGSFAVDSLPAGKRTIYLSVPFHENVYPGLHLYADTAVTVDVAAGETVAVPAVAMRPLDQRIVLVEVSRCPWALPDEDHTSCDSYPGGVNVRLEVVGVPGSPTAGLHYEGSIPDSPPPYLGTWDDTYFSTHFSVAVSGEYDVRLTSIPSPWQLSPGQTSTRRIVVGQGVTSLGFHFWFK